MGNTEAHFSVEGRRRHDAPYFIVLRKNSLRIADQTFAAVRQAQSALPAVEQLLVKLFFKTLDLLADRGLRQVQMASRHGHVSRLRDSNKRTQQG